MYFKMITDFKKKTKNYYIDYKEVPEDTYYKNLYKAKREKFSGTIRSLYVKRYNKEYKIEEWYSNYNIK